MGQSFYQGIKAWMTVQFHKNQIKIIYISYKLCLVDPRVALSNQFRVIARPAEVNKGNRSVLRVLSGHSSRLEGIS